MGELSSGCIVEAPVSVPFGFLPPHLVGERARGAMTAGGFGPPSDRVGKAWGDSEFLESLRQSHSRMGASGASLSGLDALENGAACVVTGQQPGLGGGPLYTWWKVVGAVVAARWAARDLGRPVIPVFWCGADDSDFDEVRTAFHAASGNAPRRVQLPGSLWTLGQMVGSLDAREVAAAEVAAGIRRAQTGRTARDWGEDFGAQLLADFPESGVVVVDARNERLVARGSELFRSVWRQWADHRELLRARATELEAAGWPVGLSERSLESPIFELEGTRRRRVLEGEAPSGAHLVPSVVLRALWQDRELAPVATVLGPGELAYQAQLAPLYDRLGILAPRTVPRPHLGVLPDAIGGAWSRKQLAELAASADRARSILQEQGLSDDSRNILARVGEYIAGVETAHDGPAPRPLLRYLARQRREWDRLRRALARRDAPEIDGTLEWLWPAGRPQERILSVSSLRALGVRGDDVVSAIQAQYLNALDEGRTYSGWLRHARPGGSST